MPFRLKFHVSEFAMRAFIIDGGIEGPHNRCHTCSLSVSPNPHASTT